MSGWVCTRVFPPLQVALRDGPVSWASGRGPGRSRQRAARGRPAEGAAGAHIPRAPGSRGRTAAWGSVSAETRGMEARPLVPKLGNLPRHPPPGGGLRFSGQTPSDVETPQKEFSFHCRADTRHAGGTPGSGGSSQGPSEQGPAAGRWMRRAWSPWGPAAGTRLLGKASRGAPFEPWN